MQPQTIHFGKFVMQVAPRRAARLRMVGVTGVEPVTLRLSSACSNQLSYTPLLDFISQTSNLRSKNPGGAEEIRTPDL